MRSVRSCDAVRTALALALGFPLGCAGRAIVGAGPDAKAAAEPTTDAASSGADVVDATVADADEASLSASPDAADMDAGNAWPACPDASPLIVADADTGFVYCSDGTLRRRAVVDCPFVQRPEQICPVGAEDAEPAPGWCSKDSDCTSHPYGQCLSFPMGVGCGVCEYGCVRDSDCPQGQICVCGGAFAGGGNAGQCSDTTCPGASTTCANGSDCAGAVLVLSCTWTFSCERTSGHNTCGVTGRPYLVRGENRVARVVERGDWVEGRAPDVAGLSPAARTRIGRHWTSVGLMEHASIAAFARFALHLLALAAPPELIDATHRAIADETRHARLAFGLATAYAGRELGPGALGLEGSIDGFCVEDLASALVMEGCVGETIAAIEAREALGEATDPDVREVLAVIAADELRHSELAWRSLRWLLESAAIDREHVRTIFDAAAVNVAPHPIDERASDGLRDHGVLSFARRAEIRRAALAEVVGPCAEVLLAADTRLHRVSAA